MGPAHLPFAIPYTRYIPSYDLLTSPLPQRLSNIPTNVHIISRTLPINHSYPHTTKPLNYFQYPLDYFLYILYTYYVYYKHSLPRRNTMEPKEIATWKGSTRTAAMVYHEIKTRWGQEQADKYNPATNCFTFKTWNAKGYKIKKGEKSIHSITFLPFNVKDLKGKESNRMFSKNVHLFFETQVEKQSKQGVS